MKETATLYFREGSSDKVYTAAIEEKDGLFVVNCSWGRRGSTMQTGTKTQSPVPYEAAKKIYDKLIQEKTAKGYTPGPDGTPYAQTDKAERTTGIAPQLLNAIEEAETQRLIDDPDHWMQEKLDGKRMLIRREKGTVVGINRKGLTVALPAPMDAEANKINFDFVVDGEAIGDVLHAFDILHLNGVDMQALTYGERHRALEGMLKKHGCEAFKIVPAFRTAKEKKAAFERLKKQKAEGIVFKKDTAPYKPGRPASGGSHVKFKFCETASCLVAKVNAKRSVALEMLDADDKRVPVGNVTIPANQPIPDKGNIIEVRYLYAYPNGALFQPVCLGIRDDIEPEECVLSQLKYKQSAADDDA
jgi:bifunctional non-homologous end joining protein LigD